MVAKEDSTRRTDDAFTAWAEALSSGPGTAISGMLEGRGARGAFQLAEPADFLADLLAQQSLRPLRDALVAAIDGALIKWLEERSTWPPDRIARFGTRAFVAQFSDALAVIARLPLSSSPARLIDDVATWDNRFRSLRWPDDIDLLRQFDLALSQHQPDERLAARWFASCEEAAWAGPHWRDGLDVGLLGLRKIPDPTKAQSERLVATALARFAALSSQRGTDSPDLRAEFRRHVSTLFVLYPRHDSHWKQTWANAFGSLHGFGRHRLVAHNDWLRSALPSQCFPDIGPDSNVPAQGGRPRAAPRPAYPPPKAELDEVVFALDATEVLNDALWRETQALLNRHWNYARYAHNSYYAVRTTHNLCDRLLRKHPSGAQLTEIRNWTLQSLQAENGNAYVWDLWAKVLAAVGAVETSLDVRWETVRRFPDNLVTRTALIVALKNSERLALAENLLKETLRDFPNEMIESRLLETSRWISAVSERAMRYADDPLANRVQKVIDDEQFFRKVGAQHRAIETEMGPQIRSVLASLRNRTELLERYFSPPGEASVLRDGAAPSPPISELELVVACRTGAWPQWDESLDSWLQVRPASYSLQLLALSRSIDGHGPDREEFSRLRAAFPQYHHWNQWLGYAFAAPEERDKLRQEAQDEEFWGGRLSAVYPDLNALDAKPVEPAPELWRRLFEDVALANADPGLPQFS